MVPFLCGAVAAIEALWQTQKAKGLSVLVLSIDKQPAAASACIKSKGYIFAADMVTPDMAKMLPKPKGLPMVVVFAEDGEMFPEDIEGLKTNL